MKIEEIVKDFKKYSFDIRSIINRRNDIVFYITKDYSTNFNIEFNGLITLEVTIELSFLASKTPYYHYAPSFKEISNIIPHVHYNHFFSDTGDICYAIKCKPMYEKWKFENYINAVDSMINNYFSKEYIGKPILIELEHGSKGFKQYKEIISK